MTILHDISPPITERLKVWPGDTPPTREVLLDMQRGDNITLSALHSTVHVGAHADGANHYGKDAAGIEGHDLDLYVGRCQVIHLKATPGTRIAFADLPDAITEERVLIAGNTYPDPNVFTEDFAALEPALVDALHEQGVRLVGVDAPSVDSFSSKDLPAHARFLASDMAIIEGLVLSAVPAGVYELIALPLNLPGFDASPVRAVLRAI